LCTYIAFFSAASDGVTTERQIQNRTFSSIFYQFEEGSIFTMFSSSVREQLIKGFLVSSQVAPQDSLICVGIHPKRKKIGRGVCAK